MAREMSGIVAPAATRTMAEVRAGIDSVDRQLVTLLAERMRYIDAAARIKPDRGAVRDEWRKADVLAKVAAAAEAAGYPPELASAIWEMLIEASIAHEFVRFDALRRE